MIKTSGATFNPKEGCCYFIASNLDRQQWGAEMCDHLLISVNEISDGDDVVISKWLDSGKKLFIDSGIFNLTNEHMRKHGITMDLALSLPPEKIDGFNELFDRYIEIIKKYEGKCWGYIELDQGGRENKIKTRAKLESLGLRPIPVYHPLNDGWDYFDYLAQNYDRICFGNIVQADRQTRKRLIATAWDRHRKYPDLWIHLLGFTPNEWLYAFPINSGDSSSWLSVVRWGGYKPRAAGVSLGDMPRNFQYKLGEFDSPIGSQKACRMSAYGVALNQRSWRNHLDEIRSLGFDLYPGVQ